MRSIWIIEQRTRKHINEDWSEWEFIGEWPGSIDPIVYRTKPEETNETCIQRQAIEYIRK